MRETGTRGHKSYYHQKLRSDVEQLETEALQKGKLLSDDGTVRYYWYEFDQIIGAACGEETRFLLVELHITGPFHGHPVVWAELKKKGAQDEERRRDK